MRDHSKHVQVSRDEAIAAILGACRFDTRMETVKTEDSIGRVLAEDAVAKMDMPNVLTCCMDSIALHWDSYDWASGVLPDTSSWERGADWEFANTGVAMPEGFDTAIVIEHVDVSEDEQSILIKAAPSARFAGTRPAGSTFSSGDVLVEAGTLVTPLLAAHIASGNIPEVEVVCRPKVAFLPTGNELVCVGTLDVSRKNIETNSILMAGKLRAWGAEPLLFPVTPDDPEALVAVIRQAAEVADIVVLNAGSSKGSDDWSCEVLEEIGEVLYHQTNHGPGHHSFCAVVDGTPVIGISGPPGGASFTADFYVYPAVRTYLGLDPRLKKVRARLAAPFGGHAHGAHKKANDAIKGEKRPREGGTFFGIKQVLIAFGEDGIAEATPVSSSHPNPPIAETARGYYCMPTGDGSVPSEVGDFIEVDLRPEFGF